ncbi:NAD(P)-dependent oxidoreductase [Nocardioides sp. TF02-7]|uniref:precorrin-2 dehydrogenase/sirohydrochlorin ferrochelatase family protein n=1 Tax=Nocardioides sp. TF02-7 TaxID=2917724 RepID=UPI001F06B3BF|nr:NAD(P)-dependent oxidoreductase [Nocardioides sp. TF02-7]UMG92471.1 hypothetical protein MF408_21965 [Nocardioides sp. TF02-7]
MEFPPYPSGLRLAGRRVLVVGGGGVAQRRVPQLIAAGAAVEVVSPDVTPAIEGLVASGEVVWHRRPFEDGDLDGAWYVMAVTDDPAVNDRVSALAEQQRVFCVPLRRRGPRHGLDPRGRAARRRDGGGARQPRPAPLGGRARRGPRGPAGG